MFDVSVVVTPTPAALVRLLPETEALSVPRMTLVASAPPPLMAKLPIPPDTVNEAAVEVAWMVAFSSLITEIPTDLDVVVTVVALARYAFTSLSIVFVASDSPMATDTDAPPLPAMATDTAPTLAVMA